MRKTRQGETTPQTLDLTPNTPAVNDSSPFWTRDERFIIFQSNRRDLPGTQTGTLTHIYRMRPDGGGVSAITGPLATPATGASVSQTQPSLSSSGALLLYVETDASGGVDIIEHNLNTNTTRSLVKNNPNFRFVDLNHPEYAPWPGVNIAVIFAGRVQGSQAFKLFVVDTQRGTVAPISSDPAYLTNAVDDRNPTVSPEPPVAAGQQVIAFDSNRADPDGTGAKGNRDVWVIPTAPNIPAKQVTSFGLAAVDNVEPAWSTNRQDQNGGGQQFVNGQQLLAFASTRYDPNNDGNATGPNPNGTTDIYWLKAEVARDPNDPANPFYTVTTPESQTNAALKLPTGDPNHLYSDRHPTWPQFISTYRVAFHSNRTAYNPVTQESGPPTANINDIFTSTLIDLNAPTLVRYDETSGEIVHVEPRLASPGAPVRISVKLADFETGVRDVWVQIKNPNSKYQSSDGLEHKVFQFANLALDANNTALRVPIEYESQRIFIGSDPGDGRVNSYDDPKYLASVDDFYAFTGGANPPEEGWLQLQFESRDAATGVSTYSATWVTDTYPSDYYVDVIAYDNAIDPFTNSVANWKIYDNVWGFTTQPFQPGKGILFVSDYSAGQKFFGSRFGSTSLVNVTHTFWGSESWMTDIDVNLLPRAYISGTTAGTLIDVRNTLGVRSYFDGLASDGTVVDGAPVGATQKYDLWRILCRGPVPDAVLQQYAPHVEQQPADVLAGETTPRDVLVVPRCVVWSAPYTGNVFTGPGTLVDLPVQSQLASFVRAGGRLMVNGQDIGWALTLDGSAPNPFVTEVLRATYLRDDAGFTFFRLPAVGFPFLAYGITAAYQLTGAGAYNPISHDPWVATPGKTIPSSHHVYPGPPFPDGISNFISTGDNWLVGGSDVNTPRLYGSPGNQYPDLVSSPTGVVADLTYGGGGTAVHHYADATTAGRVVYAPMGLEGYFPAFFAPPNTQNILQAKNRRTELVHNAVCWLRTGTVTGSVLDLQGAGQPLANVLVRLTNRQTGAGVPITAYTALTAEDGTFLINGVEPDDYEISAFKAGFIIQKRTVVTTHGGYRDDISFRMTAAEPAVVKGKVTRTDGTTPVVGATVTLTDNLAPHETFTATTDANGEYVISRVPSQTTYTLTVAADNFGESIPPSYQVPNPNDPIATQRDTVVQPAKTYEGFDFKLKPEQGSVTGKVLKAADGTPISGATVTATQGTQKVTAVTNDQGAYTFSKDNTPANGLDPGVWSLVATAPGYKPNDAITVTVVSKQSVTAEDIRLETTPPGLVSGLVTRTSDGAPIKGVTIELRDAAGNLVASGKTVDPVTDGDDYRYNYRLTDVPAGVTYTVTATLEGFTARPASREAAVQSQQETKSVDFQLEPLHTFSGALSLVSSPYDYAQNVADLLGIPSADRTNGSFLFATWDLRKYVYFPQPPASTLRLGRGYFLGYKSNIALSKLGTLADPNRPFDIPLNAGWNLVGDPFTFDIDWTKVSVVDGGSVLDFGQAVAAGAIGSALYGYVSGSYVLDYRMLPWRGYWVRAYRNVTLRIDPVNDAFGRAAPAARSRAALRGGDGWSVNLRAASGGLRDDDSHLGVTGRAVDGFDGYKVEKPPAFGEHYVRLTFDHDNWGDKSGGYGVDVRSSAAGSKSWEFTVNATEPNAAVTLTWPDAGTVKRGVTLTLTDLATGAVRSLRTNSSYTWSTGDTPVARRFRVDAAEATRSALRITSLASRKIGKAAGVGITFNLSAAANVEIRVLSASGGVVRTLAGRSTRAAGIQEAVWDQKSDRGIALPAGSYLVEVRAQSASGAETVRAITPIIVTR